MSTILSAISGLASAGKNTVSVKNNNELTLPIPVVNNDNFWLLFTLVIINGVALLLAIIQTYRRGIKKTTLRNANGNA
jgi:hypothetical protein